MLRCTNASALRTGVKSCPLTRLSLGSRWSRGVSGGARAISLSYPAPRGIAPGQISAWRLPVGARRYSTNSEVTHSRGSEPLSGTEGIEDPESVDVSEELDDSEPLVASEGLEDRLLEPEPSLKSRQGITRDDLLLSIAKAGTSPKTREELDGTMPVKVSGKVVEMELKWLKDPRALSDRVGRLLKADDVLLAVALVRTAQREHMECTVAWNHLMEYCMEKNNPKAALKFYNEVRYYYCPCEIRVFAGSRADNEFPICR